MTVPRIVRDSEGAQTGPKLSVCEAVAPILTLPSSTNNFLFFFAIESLLAACCQFGRLVPAHGAKQ